MIPGSISAIQTGHETTSDNSGEQISIAAQKLIGDLACYGNIILKSIGNWLPLPRLMPLTHCKQKA